MIVRARGLAVALAGWMIAASTGALACGFEDPRSAAVARGGLNWSFPDALHVTSAIWMAQAHGAVPRDDAQPSARALFGFQRTAAKLAALRGGLSIEDGRPSLSVVLIGPMLWTRFSAGEGGVDMTLHSSGPASGDVVVVTDEPVVTAIVERRISPSAARDLGLIRLYGAPEAVARAALWLDRWRTTDL